MSTTGRYFVLAASFLGWMFAGVQLAVTSLVMRDAAKDLLGSGDEGDFGLWFGRLVTAFLLGAATGGYLLGWLGDKVGRKKAMVVAIAIYSFFAGATYWVQTPGQLVVLRFLTCIGVGGMWPNGIALVSEAWPKLSRPLLAGVIGTAANVGIMLASTVVLFVHVTPEDWRWTMLAGLAPIGLAVLCAWLVPESPRWVAAVQDGNDGEDNVGSAKSPLVEIFRPPLLQTTLLGILLGTIPLFGGWGASNWANAWASQVGDKPTVADTKNYENTDKKADPALKGRVLLARSAPGSLSSLLGGAVASFLGLRRSYFIFSLACFGCAQYLFWFAHPHDQHFLIWTGALGLFSGFFFGWLPFCLPGLFPTRVRSTGAGASFNFGRIATALAILAAAEMLKQMFGGDYAQIGRVTSWIYAFGLVLAWFIPDSTEKDMVN